MFCNVVENINVSSGQYQIPQREKIDELEDLGQDIGQKKDVKHPGLLVVLISR